MSEDDNIVPFPRPGKKERGEPFLNLPPATTVLVGAIFGIHALIWLFVDPAQQYRIFEQFGFVPAAFSEDGAPLWRLLLSPFSYMFLHGGWMHASVNGFMTLAFGAGVERMIGGKRMILLFVLCGMASVFLHFLFNLHSDDPVVGASGGLSGLFGAALVMMQASGQLGSGQRGLWPLVVFWIAVTALFGVTGIPGGGTIAWQAHIGGFLAGLALIRFFRPA